jgi:hypothetical protein
MKLNSNVTLANESGHHVALDDKPCTGRTFHVVSVGVGGIYHNVVQCDSCQRQFKIYGEHILDPFVERLLSRADENTGSAAIKMSYRYLHRNANGQSDLPSKWFNDFSKAIDAFNGVTEEALLSAWPRYDMSDRLIKIVMELYRKGSNEWECVDRREYNIP